MPEPLEALRLVVDAFGGDFSEYGPCHFVVNESVANGICGKPGHWIEYRRAGARFFYCDAHVDERPDPLPVQQLPHAPALREAQRALEEAGDG